MWKLKLVGESVLSQYADDILIGLRNRIVNSTLLSGDKEILIPHYKSTDEDLSNIRKLLIYEPVELEAHCTALMSQLIIGYNPSEFQIYLDNYTKKSLTGTPKKIVDKYKNKLETLENIFDYEGQISHNKKRSYWLSRMKGSNACTYCNRQYTFTIEKFKLGKVEKQVARPDLDHWFCKQLYPLMSLSFYNLIPSCHICNSSSKSNVLFSLSTHVHPYLQQDDNPKIHFRQKLTAHGWSVDIERTPGSKEDNTVKDFNLEDIYRYHGPLEVKDLVDFDRSFTKGYLSKLYKHVLKDTFGVKSQEEVYRMLFGTELDPAEFCNRPLSKLKHDILENLKIIK
jgi:hypothetical protein